MSLQTEHHVWCNNYNANRKGCVECDQMFKKYPDVHWDNLQQKTNQYFPEGRNGTTAKNSRQPVR